MPTSSAAPLRACALLLCLVAGSRQLSIKEFMVPRAVEVGREAELRCLYDLAEGETETLLYVKWWWTPDSGSSDVRKLIYQRIAGQDPASNHFDNTSEIVIKNNDSIVLTAVNPVDSGTYECEVSNIEEIRKHEKLIVFTMGVGPKLNYTLVNSEVEEEEDALVIECEAEDVAPMPDMTITFRGDQLNISTIVEDTNNDGFYNIYANATVLVGDIEESEILCELFYTNLEHPPSVAVETYVPTGRETPSTSELPEDTIEPEATPESLQNSSDAGIPLNCSWVLLAFAVVVVQFQSTP